MAATDNDSPGENLPPLSPRDRERLLALTQAEVKRTLAELPPELRDAAAELPVVYEHRPEGNPRETGVELDTLGLFVGAPRGDALSTGELFSPHIVLFLENLWLEADFDEEWFREEVRVTLLHELGHYLGLDESDLEDRDLL